MSGCPLTYNPAFVSPVLRLQEYTTVQVYKCSYTPKFPNQFKLKRFPGLLCNMMVCVHLTYTGLSFSARSWERKQQQQTLLFLP